MSIIKSILDNDLYKFVMQNAVLSYKPNILVQYKFYNRRPEGRFTSYFAAILKEKITEMEKLRLTHDEAIWLEEQCPFLDKRYIDYLRNYRYNPDEVSFRITQERELSLCIEGTWESTILWEVPLMAIISELYFKHCSTNWAYDHNKIVNNLHQKAYILRNCYWADFGTRRRRTYITQDTVINEFKYYPGFMGTSNVHLAHKHNVKPIGTIAHEWIMGISALEGLRHANKHALRIWGNIYKGNLGIALTDTFGTDSFLKDFDLYLAKLFDGVRHDSGDPVEFGNKVIKHYSLLGIDSTTKTIVFSDSLDPETAAMLEKTFRRQIKTSFGIGTNFTNDFENSRALNMVIKMHKCDGIPVVKLSDSPTKQMGDQDALRVANIMLKRGEIFPSDFGKTIIGYIESV